jgi:hypothetical protein
VLAFGERDMIELRIPSAWYEYFVFADLTPYVTAVSYIPACIYLHRRLKESTHFWLIHIYTLSTLTLLIIMGYKGSPWPTIGLINE